MGALTSKPFAFRARPWETKSIEFFDIFSILFQPLRYDVRGHMILRIIPRNNTLITDQARFFFDSIASESYLLASKGLSFNNSSKQVMEMNFLRSLYLKHFTVYRLFAGRFIDTPESNAMNEFSTLVGNTFVMGDHYNISLDAPSDLFNSTLTSFQIFQSILLIFTSIRLEAPLVSLQVQSHPLVYNVGDASTLFSLVHTTSSDNQNNIGLAFGKHSIWKYLLQYSSCLLIIGSRITQLKEKAFNLTSLVIQWLQQLSKVGVEGIYTSFSLLPSLTALNLNLLMPKFLFKAFATTLLFNAEAITSSQKFSVFYQGSHYDNGARASNVIWPGLKLTEHKTLKFSFANGIYYKNFQILPSSIKASVSSVTLLLLRMLLGFSIQSLTYINQTLAQVQTLDTFFFDNEVFIDSSYVESQIAFWNVYESTIYHRQSIALSIANRRFLEIIGNIEFN